ncbi:MAG: NAD(P)-dependent oxidoreductase [Proteobacteria bacterium]|nr:NAD(P)-dependent oxidoreductase [Pseudomonadota bacterium]
MIAKEERIIVTGGRGTIGRRVVEKLRAAGHQVVSLDRSTGETIDELASDVTRFEEVHSTFAEFKPTCVLHMASEVGRMVGEKRPARMLEVSIAGTMNVIQLCLAQQTRLVYLSTSEVYGNLGERVLEETVDATQELVPTNVYAWSKLFCERLCGHYVRNYGLKAAIVRPFMVYGPGEFPNPYRSAMSNFIFRALTGKKLTVHRGTARAWTFVDDFVDGLIAVATKGRFDLCEVYNIGRDETKPMEEVAAEIVKAAGASPDLIELVDPPAKFNSPVKIGSFKRAKEILGFEARTSLVDGIAATVAWQRSAVLPVARAMDAPAT